MAGYALDPLGFVLFAFPWGEAGTELAGTPGRRQWQWELLADLGRRLREGHEAADPTTVMRPYFS